ncbi:MAG: NAD/NADP octopine/nopaline dehydrogenase family protein [Castellaniella sp.]|uniref:NAD/NADP octopine/nopaline dehydrogenase family protein n=1 Tax=Castellaniella sp. TaxID=1955812 RepID=UPI003C719A60
MNAPVRVAILGAGGVGLASAALLAHRGHTPILWSRHASAVQAIQAQGVHAQGVLEGQFAVQADSDLAAVVGQAGVILLAVPANGRRPLFDRLLPMIRPGQTLIISGDLSLGGCYLHRQLTAAGIAADVAAWSTTAVMGRRLSPHQVLVGGIRPVGPMAVLPVSASDRAIALCSELFGSGFTAAEPLAILLGNLNPPVHMANALCNITRIEKAEAWGNYDGITPAVARLIEDLDQERLDLAARCGLNVRSVRQHFHRSFDLPDTLTLAEMAAELHRRRRGGPPGPTSLNTRFLTEDLPFGIWPMIRAAQLQGIRLPLHEAGLTLLGSLCGQDFAAANDLIDGCGLDDILAQSTPAA